jgi:hypothetical protein
MRARNGSVSMPVAAGGDNAYCGKQQYQKEFFHNNYIYNTFHAAKLQKKSRFLTKNFDNMKKQPTFATVNYN